MLEERVCFETGQLQDDPKSYLQKAAHRSHTNSNLKKHWIYLQAEMSYMYVCSEDRLPEQL